MNVGVLCSRIRLEEKLIFQALRERGVGFERIDVRQAIFDLNGATLGDYDVVLICCLAIPVPSTLSRPCRSRV